MPTPRQRLNNVYRAEKPNNFHNLELVLTTITNKPNQKASFYIEATGLSEKTYQRCMDTLEAVGLIYRGPVPSDVSGINDMPVPPSLKNGFIPDWGNFPATHMAYYFAQYPVDSIPPGFRETVAVYGNWVGGLLGEDENKWKMFSCFLQEMLAVAAIGSLNFTLFQKPNGPIDLPDDPDESVLHCLKVIRPNLSRYLE